MGVLIRIALRNLLEHTAKTLFIGLIIRVGVIVIVVGNAFLDRAELGIRKAFTENFTGDIYVYGEAPTPTSILFGRMSASNMEETPLLPDFNRLIEEIRERPEVTHATGLVTTLAMFNLEDTSVVGPRDAGQADTEGSEAETDTANADAAPGGISETGMLGGAVLMGIEPESYRAMFDNVTIIDGRYLAPGEEGLMLSRGMVERIEEHAGVSIGVGDTLILQGFGSSGFRSRKVAITALFESKGESEANEFLAFADVNTVRLLSGLTVGGAGEVEVPESAQTLLSAESEDDIFGAEESVESGSSVGAVAEIVAETAGEPRPVVTVDTGAWQYILIRLENPAAAPRTIASLNVEFFRNGTAARAADWKGAAAPFAQSIDLVRAVLSIVILILAVVAIVVIMNTLVVSIIERTGEIGTMRALGAQKGFVWRMFFTETLCITLTFGTIGIVLSWLVMGAVNLIGFEAGNSFLRVLFGGPVLHLTLNAGAVVSTFVVVALVSIVAHLYPVIVALRIPPVRAMQSRG